MSDGSRGDILSLAFDQWWAIVDEALGPARSKTLSPDVWDKLSFALVGSITLNNSAIFGQYHSKPKP